MDSQVTYLMWAVALLCLVAWGARGDGNAPTAAEMNDLRQWVRANIEGDASPLAVVPGLTVVENHGPVHLNSRGGAPMRLGGEMLRSGLYCHAPSRIQVVLDRPAASLRARLGVDSNDQTSGGRGSVVFRVVATGMDLWSSPVLREGAPLASTALKVAHHGSCSSTSEEFLRAVDPTLAVISVGENDFGHPCEDVLARLGDIPVYRTDNHGAVELISDGTQVWVDPKR